MNTDELATLSKPKRLDLWVDVVNQAGAETMLELGVWRGEFAQHILAHCPKVKHYYMLDPWKHLARWAKPSNVDQGEFDKIYEEAMSRTDFAAERRIVLRGQTVEVIEDIPNEALDLIYIDGDHTLKGISIDMIRAFPKLKIGGILGGDDYSPTIWQHADKYEPTLVCPFAAYFAEAVGAPLVIYPQNQFAFIKPNGYGADFRIVDTTKRYGEPVLRPQIARPPWAYRNRILRALSRPFSLAPFRK